jgi:hypothetical protein
MSVRPPVCLCLSVCLSACIHMAPTRWTSVKFDIWDFLQKSVEKVQFLLKLGKNIEHFTWKPKHVLLLLVTLHHHKSALFEWNGFLSVHLPTRNKAAPNRQIYMKPDMGGLPWKSVQKFQIFFKSGKNIGDFMWNLCFTVASDIKSQQKHSLQVKWYQAIRTDKEVQMLCDYVTICTTCTLPILLKSTYINMHDSHNFTMHQTTLLTQVKHCSAHNAI